MDLDTSIPQGLESSPLNFIYACSICCATFADAYEGHNETVQGLSDGINPKERLVTKLYLGNCCHVFCGEHIEGGGPPFHPAGQKPKAPCPVCVKEKGDNTVRELYSIRGFHKDEYDPAIPPVWFMAPPISLDGNGKEMEALRFQYLALIRYCQTSYRTRKPLENALKNTKKELATIQNHAAEEHTKIVALQHENEKIRGSAQQIGDADALRAEVQRLQHLEQEMDQFNADLKAFRRLRADVRDLGTFRQNKAAILQHLKLVPKLIKQNEKMQERLASLGFAMAVEPIPNYTQLTPDDLNEIGSIAEACSKDDKRFQQSSSSHTVGRSAHTSGNGAAAHSFTSSDRPLKRQRVDSPLPYDVRLGPPSSRDAMPPPSKPLSRMRSVRKLIPTIRKKFSSGRSTPREYQKNNDDIQMCDNGQWQDTADSCIDDNKTASYHETRNEKQYMTGALPVEPASKGSRLLANAGVHVNESDFTFRKSSPARMNDGQREHQPVQLPSGPSYLNVMDGLSHDNGLELGLKDPRENAVSHYVASTIIKPSVSTPQYHRQIQESSGQQGWGLGHAFLHQSPKRSSKPANRHRRASPPGKSKNYFNRSNYDPSPWVATEASNRLEPVRQLEHVVSPFFGRSHYDAHTPSQFRNTETQTSSNHFDAFQLQRYPNSQVSTEWHEPRNLNGLSFFSSPPDSCNKPILNTGHYQPSRYVTSKSYQAHNLDSRSLVTRSDTHRSLYNANSGYGPSMQIRPTFSRQRQTQLQSTMPFPSPSRGSSLRVAQLCSRMPSTVSSHSSVRNRTQLETLQQAGVRSSRQTHGKTQEHAYHEFLAMPPLHTERRRVRR